MDIKKSLRQYSKFTLGRVHINLKSSIERAKCKNPMKITSSLSNLVKILRYDLILRNSLSISLRLLYLFLSNFQGLSLLGFGGVMGIKFNFSARFRVAFPSYAPSISKKRVSGCLPSFSSNLLPSGASPQFPGVRLNASGTTGETEAI